MIIAENASKKNYQNSVPVVHTVCNNYRTKLTKMAWFDSGGQINYLPNPKAEANNWSVRSLSLPFMIILGWHFLTRAITGRRKAWFHLRISRILFAATHGWKTLHSSRPLSGIIQKNCNYFSRTSVFRVNILFSRTTYQEYNLTDCTKMHILGLL